MPRSGPYGLFSKTLFEGALRARAGDLVEPFLFLVAHCDTDGVVEMAPEEMAARSCIPLDDVQAALAALEVTPAADGSPYLVRLGAHRWRLVGGRGVEWKPGSPRCRRGGARG